MNYVFRQSTVALTILLVAGLALADTKKPDESLKEPPVSAKLASKGVVYHTISGRHAQVTFTSKAPLENIVGKSNAIVGYVVSGPADSPAELSGAQWLLPVHSLATGLPLRDDHMVSHEWLDAETYPLIGFKLTKTEDVTLIKSGNGFTTWSATLIGEMSLHGVTRTIHISDATLSFLTATSKTEVISKGDLHFLKCSYKIKMSDFGIKNKDVPDKVADFIELKQVLRLTTVQQDIPDTKDDLPPKN